MNLPVRWILSLVAIAAAVIAGPNRAEAAPGSGGGSAAGVSSEATNAEPPVFRVQLNGRLTRREFALEGPEKVDFAAPHYPGLDLTIDVWPVAVFAPDSAFSPLAVYLVAGKHQVTTLTEIGFEGGSAEIEVPTRHDLTSFGVRWNAEVNPEWVVIPRLGMTTIEYGLAYNPYYRSSYYQSAELGSQAVWRVNGTPHGLLVELDLSVRPFVDLGSTVQPYGRTAQSWGFGFGLGASWVLKSGLFASLVYRQERYSTEYLGNPDGTTTGSDLFETFGIGAGHMW